MTEREKKNSCDWLYLKHLGTALTVTYVTQVCTTGGNAGGAKTTAYLRENISAQPQVKFAPLALKVKLCGGELQKYL